jgi:hypothetical protein
MSLIEEMKLLYDKLIRIKEKLGLQSNSANSRSGSLFKALEVRKNSVSPDIGDQKLIVNKHKKSQFRISYIRNAVQFLDIKSILNLSMVNKEFSHFIKSVYFYKFMKNIKDSVKKKEKIQHKETKKTGTINNEVKSQASSGNSSIFGSFVNAFGSVLGSFFNKIRFIC